MLIAGSKAVIARSPYRGRYLGVDPLTGDTVINIVMHEVTVYPELKFDSKEQEDFYWRTVRDVRRTLPWAKLISETLIETYEYIETFPTQQEREDYIKEMEGEIFNQYKPDLKKLTRNQARTLVKLIQRETDQSGYDILKAFLGSFRAGFWQGFGRLFGVNLNAPYDPSKSSEDATIDRIATLIEQGAL
ncbi:MAG: DUF4294 domain-containing protein [Muribaculaceae bacterium]|nr:DUF4294 domain-containing protein [Muribaculaceae bacterium]